MRKKPVAAAPATDPEPAAGPVRPGVLYVVATPIGNLGDLSRRAASVLDAVDLIAAEDTRHTATLLRHYGITTPTRSCHEFNERRAAEQLIGCLEEGQSVALVSDAGTPLISDPGFRLVNRAHESGIPVIPVPGPSAVTAALSACGLPVARFCFEGYLPERAPERRRLLEHLAAEPRTLVFFETPHRIRAALADMVDAFGEDRDAALGRELTKRFETVQRGNLGALRAWLEADSDRERGEFVIVAAGVEAVEAQAPDARRLLMALLDRLSIRDAATVAAQALGTGRNEMYRLALDLAGEKGKKPVQ